jgi:dissimilatory sulfite reductase (desulfoviridin) alpha/beta subunit
MTAPTSSIDYAALKSGGIIMQKDDDFFALRLRLPGGCTPIASELLPKIAQVARRHGRGEVLLIARAGIEIPWIKLSGEVWRIVVKK